MQLKLVEKFLTGVTAKSRTLNLLILKPQVSNLLQLGALLEKTPFGVFSFSKVRRENST